MLQLLKHSCIQGDKLQYSQQQSEHVVHVTGKINNLACFGKHWVIITN